MTLKAQTYKQNSENLQRKPTQQNVLGTENSPLELTTIVQRTKLDQNLLTQADLLQLQRTIGNQAVGKLIQNTPLQIKNTGSLLRQVSNPTIQNQQRQGRKTYVIVYGSGQESPTSSGHDVKDKFRLAAQTKLIELRSRLGVNSGHRIIFEYIPTELELKRVLNQRYDTPIAEIHIFSHGWDAGVNLGGVIPSEGRAQAESSDQKEERWIKADDLKEFNINFSDDAKVVFYGCNIGKLPTGFAQQFSDKFGVSVTASATPTHFEPDSKNRIHQVSRWRMRKFVPTVAGFDGNIKEFLTLVSGVKQLQKISKALSGYAKQCEDLKGRYIEDSKSFLSKITGQSQQDQANAKKLENEALKAREEIIQNDRSIIPKINLVREQMIILRRSTQYLPNNEQANAVSRVQELNKELELLQQD